jgi:RsiW-degrading membrane proteinase PrsW (M82 family)
MEATSTMVLAACCGGFLPVLFFATLVYSLDRYEKEPWYLIVAAFLWGAFVATIFSLIAQLVVQFAINALVANPEALTPTLFQSSVWAPFTEELSKGAAVILLALVFRREFDSLTDGILYGAMVGFGFEAVENVLYLTGAGLENGWGALLVLFFLRGIIFGLNHAFFTSLTGAGVAAARLSRSPLMRWLAPLAGLAAAMFFHGVHNVGATLAGANEDLGLLGLSALVDWIGIAGIFVVMLLALRTEQRWMTAYLPEEVTSGVLNSTQYQISLSARRRTSAAWRPLARGDLNAWRRSRRFYGLCSELAQKKYQCVIVGDQYQTEVERLRAELAQLAPEVQG